jgi:hypothetical protein
MYDRHFASDWDSLSQEAAMFRAYALGVDAALGNDPGGELRALEQAHHRALIQIAFDEGKSDAESALQDPTVQSAGEAAADRERRVWDQLVAATEAEPSAMEPVSVPRSRVDLPASLSLPDLLERPQNDPDRIELPRFLLR